MSNPLNVLMQLPPEARAALMQHAGVQPVVHQPQSEAWSAPQIHVQPSPAVFAPPYQAPVQCASQGATQQAPLQTVSESAEPKRRSPALKLEHVAKLVLYLHAVRESESLARLLMRMDVEEARLQGQHMTERHRAAIEAELSRWPRARMLRTEVLNALVMGLVALFALPHMPPLDSQPCLEEDFQKLPCFTLRDERIGITKETQVNVHSALLNQSKIVPQELYEILSAHDAHHDYVMRMKRRMRALDSK